LRRLKKEWRNVRLYGQERNLMTSSIARMNCFLHGIEDFRIERGDTLSEPKFVQGDRLQRFDVVLANPPYSIKQWDRDAFASDPWGRNLYGTPPPGRADYAFWQHIQCSLDPKTGRCAILFPHGVLFRQEESDMRRKLIEADAIECILGLGPNLFYNSPMEACVVICRSAKPKARKNKILLINAINEVTRERAQSFLTDDHIEHIVNAYEKFANDPGFARVVTLEEIRAKDGNLSLPLYIASAATGNNHEVKAKVDLVGSMEQWRQSSTAVGQSLAELLPNVAVPNWKDKTNPAWAKLPLFNRRNWSRVRFGDVVRQLKEQVDPVIDGVERYVEGGHMETDNVHIRRWGNVGDGYLGPAFIRGFRKGQVLYGSRRTYLKKVAVAEWDGVTANTTYVLETDESKLLQSLLPWLMLSEKFTRHSVQESKGSTNPYINFPDIAKFEFDLPPLDQQRRIAEILWAVDENIQASSVNLDVLSALKYAAMEEYTLYGKPVKSDKPQQSRHPMRLLDEVATCQYGLSCALNETGRYPILRMMNYDEELVAATDLKYADMSADVAADFEIKKGDILFNRTNSADLVGKVGIANLDGCYLFASYLVRVQTDRSVLLPAFLNYYLNSPHGQTSVREFATPGVSQSNISAGNLKKVKVPVPPIREQESLVRKLDEIASAHRTTRAHVATQRRILQTLINSTLGDQL
jgi:restriction endonuclease S subunit